MKILIFPSVIGAVLYGSLHSEIIGLIACGVFASGALLLIFVSLYRHFMAMLP